MGTPAAVHTPEPLATFSGSHIPASFYALVLPGQDWACVSCLGMCLAQAEPSGVELARFYGRPRNSRGRGMLCPKKRNTCSIDAQERVVVLLKPYHRKELE